MPVNNNEVLHFFGFCALSTLLLVYLANRQVLLARARRTVVKDQEAMLRAQKDVTANFLGSLPDLRLFQVGSERSSSERFSDSNPFHLSLFPLRPLAARCK
jgi:hypothetical protein